jgi:2-phosphosulfolactate phosphatase
MMEIRFHPTPATLEKDELHGATVVVIDVLRATSTIIAAIEQGASNVIPVESIEAASRLAGAGDRGGKLLAGEQKGMPVEGFDLFNSPVEIERTDVAGKTIVLATSNGSPAIVAASRAESVLICAIRNVDATIAALGDCERLTILCGGDAGKICSEDLLCGGMILEGLGPQIDRDRLTDPASLALLITRSVEGSIARFLRGTDRGRRLSEIGFQGDIEWCARRGGSTIVPRFRQGSITP